ncbi:MAG: hypothetical protein HY719_03880, partial [Planctomycetes bacterium]|nr:hypothetical protein [Planctomycetota bacterium]
GEGREAGGEGRVATWFAAVNLAPTLLDLLGIPAPALCDGHSAADLVRRAASRAGGVGAPAVTASADSGDGGALVIGSREVVAYYSGDTCLVMPRLGAAEILPLAGADGSARAASPGDGAADRSLAALDALRGFALHHKLLLPPETSERLDDKKLIDDLRRLGYWD